jgi:hypothetical protein
MSIKKIPMKPSGIEPANFRHQPTALRRAAGEEHIWRGYEKKPFIVSQEEEEEEEEEET